MIQVKLLNWIGLALVCGGLIACQKSREQTPVEHADHKVGLPAQVEYAQKQLGVTSAVVTEQQLDFYSTSGGTKKGENPPVAPGKKNPISGVGGEPALSSYQPNQFRPS